MSLVQQKDATNVSVVIKIIDSTHGTPATSHRYTAVDDAKRMEVYRRSHPRAMADRAADEF